jgi:hypothetical protein
MAAYGYLIGLLIIGVIGAAVRLVAAKHERHTRKRALSDVGSMSAQLSWKKIVRVRTAKLVLELEQDQHGRIVGVEIFALTSIDVGAWYQHPDRTVLPEALRNAIDAWFRETNTAR